MARPFPAEFRMRAVALDRAGKPITTAAVELGVITAAIHNCDELVSRNQARLATYSVSRHATGCVMPDQNIGMCRPQGLQIGFSDGLVLPLGVTDEAAGEVDGVRTAYCC